MNDLDKYFSKQFQFTKSTKSGLSFKDQNLDKEKITILNNMKNLKTKLNLIKAETGKHDLNEWSAHTKSRDPSQGLFKIIRQKYWPEMLTQAWLKFYEILSNFDVVNFTRGKDLFHYNSVHLCEAPGAFVAALNNFLFTNVNNYKFKYLATTLNPYYAGNSSKEMIHYDRFILNNFHHWYFGIDDTGDLRSFENYIGLIVKVRMKFENNEINMVTADGSIDCMDDPENQETIVTHLIFCETVTALSILSKGGTYIFKMFTMFEKNSAALLKLVHNSFENITVFKPCTSKSGNSEVYIVCTNYLGLDVLDDIWPVLLKFYRTGSSTDLSEYIQVPNAFLQEILQCVQIFTNYQIQTITENLLTFRTKQLNNDELKNNIVRYFLETKCKIKKLDRKHSLMNVPHDKLYVSLSRFSCKDNFLEIDVASLGSFQILFNYDNIDLVKLEIIVGRKYKTVLTTKFCDQIIPNNITKFFKTPTVEFLHLINCEEFYDVNDFDLYEKKCFENIFNLIKILRNGDSLCLVNFFPLTMFNINVLSILKNTFQLIAFNSERRQILLKNYIKNDKIYQQLETIFFVQQKLECTNINFKSLDDFPKSFLDIIIFNYSKCNKYNKSIIRFLDPKYVLLDNFYELIKYYNNNIFVEDDSKRRKKLTL